jgi:hypothetical protein
LKIKEIKTCWNGTANLSSLSTTMRTSTFSGRENRYVIAIVFTTQGSVWCFKTSNDDNGDGVDHESIDKFKLYGEELLQSLNHSPSHKKMLPITSTKIVRTHSKVETFALMANDLKHLFPKHTRAAEATNGFVQGVIRHLN